MRNGYIPCLQCLLSVTSPSLPPSLPSLPFSFPPSCQSSPSLPTPSLLALPSLPHPFNGSHFPSHSSSRPPPAFIQCSPCVKHFSNYWRDSGALKQMALLWWGLNNQSHAFRGWGRLSSELYSRMKGKVGTHRTWQYQLTLSCGLALWYTVTDRRALQELKCYE